LAFKDFGNKHHLHILDTYNIGLFCVLFHFQAFSAWLVSVYTRWRNTRDILAPIIIFLGPSY